MKNEELIEVLNMALRIIDEKYNKIAKSHGLTFNMLMYIYMIERGIDITQKDICDALFLQKSSVNSITNKFISDGFIVLFDGKNKKEKTIIKTKLGNDVFYKIYKEVKEMEENELSKLNMSDKNNLMSICKKVLK